MNVRNEDGCDSSGKVEKGWICKDEPSICTPICADGILKGSEVCDDGL